MRFRLIIDKEKDEEVVVTAKERSDLTDRLERLVIGENTDTLVAYNEDDTVFLPLQTVVCCTVIDGKTFAIDSKGQMHRLKQRLYELETALPENFIRINKSCIGNIKLVERFAATYSGGINAVFQGGYADYVSRRCFSVIKRRLSIK